MSGEDEGAERWEEQPPGAHQESGGAVPQDEHHPGHLLETLDRGAGQAQGGAEEQGEAAW